MILSEQEYYILLEKLDVISQVNLWEKCGIIFSGISSFLALALAVISWCRSLQKIVKIKKIQVYSILDEKKEEIIDIAFQAYITHHVNLGRIIKFNNAYIIFDNIAILEYKSITKNQKCLNFYQNFRLSINNKESLHKIVFNELSLLPQKYMNIKKAKVIVCTSIGNFEKKLTKDEIQQFINCFKQIIK